MLKSPKRRSRLRRGCSPCREKFVGPRGHCGLALLTSGRRVPLSRTVGPASPLLCRRCGVGGCGPSMCARVKGTGMGARKTKEREVSRGLVDRGGNYDSLSVMRGGWKFHLIS